MSAECGEPGPEGLQGWSPGPGGHSGAMGSGPCPSPSTPTPWSLPRWRAYVAAAVLCYINLLNYMNWFIIAGVLLDVQKFFQISDSNAGLLQTVFVGCLLLSAPVFGYLGDRHSRKVTLSLGILLWSAAGLSGSFISPRYSWLFFLSRGVVGTGTASYSTTAPTVLGDLFVRDQRTRVLAIFYICIPVGSGLGYVLGSAVTELTGNWRWALRIMPCLEAVALILLIVLVPDPPRGAAEKQGVVTVGGPRSTWCEDVRYLGRNWSFVGSTLGVTAMAFVTGALGFWAPKFLFEARVVHGLQLPCFREPCNSQDSLIFGVLTVVTGLVGVILGAEASRRYKKVNPRAEPLICAASLLTAAPCLYLALILAPTTLLASYVFLALGELLLSCNWAVVADILLISSALRAARPDSYLQRFLSLQQSFLCCAFVIALGGGCFLLTALHLERDQAQAQARQTGIPDSKDEHSEAMESQCLLPSTGVLLDIQQHFGVKDRGAGLLQSAFICSFMVAAPIFGYLGDRFNRRVILSCGIFFWSAVTFSSSFIPQQHFWLLVLSRGLVGIGEASYSTIAPTIIGDLFTKNTRTLMLSVFYFAIPLGSGLGYITGSSVKQAAGDWHWALRVSPILGMITGTLILVLVPATKRGHADQLGGQLKARTSWLRDMKALIRNRSYVFSSLATSAVSFATGALGMWIPLYLHRAQVVQKAAETCSSPPCAAKDSLIFGAITCFTGFLGVVTGAGATRWCRLRTQRADPLVCAVGMLGSAIFICLIFVAAKSSIVGAYICIFVGETLLFSNWAITADILMYVVIPTRRATAVALQSFTSHLLGDAGSPYLIGFISDLIRQSTKDSPLWEFLSLGYALMLCPFVVVLGGMFFLATALFFLSDRAKAEQQCYWDNEEPWLLPSLGGVPRRPGPVGLSRSFPCDPQLGAHRLWSGTAEWPWLQEAVSSTNLEGCVCWNHTLGQTPRPGSGLQGPWAPGRRQPTVGMWGEAGLSPAYVILGPSLPSPDSGAGGLDFPAQLAGQGVICSFEDTTTLGLHRGEVAQASGRHFRL
ncbi:protein spinster homolog 2 isoform X3 [Neophocaena asiaeorientalis asiaeorientalis]|uniref:Protein spinster homolog 2 isoform X3 n=1 Tax=Neophocaena asiaeorientalis asiaeorientalis TaxID=1706337 RepID=A0A341AMT8_NEOAA|nr:protein spinster homolog 2 isoform X3 [Neophocaena asiaeorientalis asiaeorientalis]